MMIEELIYNTPTDVTTATKVFVDGKGIVHMVFLGESPRIDREEALTLRHQRLAVARESERQLVIMDVRNNPRVTREGKKISREKKTAPYTKAMAIIVSSPFSMMLGNMAIGMYKNSFPTKLFLSEAEASSWLLTMEDI